MARKILSAGKRKVVPRKARNGWHFLFDSCDHGRPKHLRRAGHESSPDQERAFKGQASMVETGRGRGCRHVSGALPARQIASFQAVPFLASLRVLSRGRASDSLEATLTYDPPAHCIP